MSGITGDKLGTLYQPAVNIGTSEVVGIFENDGEFAGLNSKRFLDVAKHAGQDGAIERVVKENRSHVRRNHVFIGSQGYDLGASTALSAVDKPIRGLAGHLAQLGGDFHSDNSLERAGGRDGEHPTHPAAVIKEGTFAGDVAECVEYGTVVSGVVVFGERVRDAQCRHFYLAGSADTHAPLMECFRKPLRGVVCGCGNAIRSQVRAKVCRAFENGHTGRKGLGCLFAILCGIRHCLRV